MGKFNLDEFDFESDKTKQTPKGKKPAESKQQAAVPAVQAPASAGKVPMMNIRFTPENYAYMRQEAAMRGISVIKLTNWIVDQYRQDPSHVHTNPLYQNEEAW